MIAITCDCIIIVWGFSTDKCLVFSSQWWIFFQCFNSFSGVNKWLKIDNITKNQRIIRIWIYFDWWKSILNLQIVTHKCMCLSIWLKRNDKHRLSNHIHAHQTYTHTKIKARANALTLWIAFCQAWHYFISLKKKIGTLFVFCVFLVHIMPKSNAIHLKFERERKIKN